MKHYPLSGMIKTFFLPANYLNDYDRDNTDPQIDLPETIEYKICRLLYMSENDTGSNDEVLNYVNWDYLRAPVEYLKLNPWVFDKRPKN